MGKFGPRNSSQVSSNPQPPTSGKRSAPASRVTRDDAVLRPCEAWTNDHHGCNQNRSHLGDVGLTVRRQAATSRPTEGKDVFVNVMPIRRSRCL